MPKFRDFELDARAKMLTRACDLLVTWRRRHGFRDAARVVPLSVVVFDRHGAEIVARRALATTLTTRGRAVLAKECATRKVLPGSQLLFIDDDKTGGSFEVVNHSKENAAMHRELEEMKARLATLEAEQTHVR